jgi:predicted TIM-barrel fold metal-dependent hydrolase
VNDIQILVRAVDIQTAVIENEKGTGTVAVPAYDGPIFDADTHLYEAEDAFRRHLPPDLQKEWGFHYEIEGPSRILYIGHRKVEVSAGYYTADGKVPAPGKLHEWLRAMAQGKAEVDMRVAKTPDMLSAAPRIQKMNEFGVEKAFIYCGDMVSGVSYLDDPPAAARILHAYNQWMLDDWQFTYQDRLFSAPVITLHDLDWACKEAKWAVENNARLILMPMGPANNRAPAHPDHDRFWSILNEAHVRVVYHVSEAIYLKDHMAVWGERMQSSRLKQTAFVWMHGYSERPVIETLSSFLFWNFFERFPNIKLLSAENGAEWVPAMLRKMDKVRGIAKNGHWPSGQLKERPSRIFKRHIGVVAYPEDDLAQIIEQCDGDASWILMGSDYPHSEGVPEPRDFMKEACEGLTAEQVRMVMYDNALRFMKPAGS